MSDTYQTVYDYGSASSGGVWSGVQIGIAIALIYLGVKKYREGRYNSEALIPGLGGMVMFAIGIISICTQGALFALRLMAATEATGAEVRQVAGAISQHWVKQEDRGAEGKPRLVTVEHFRVGRTSFSFIQGAGSYFSNEDQAFDLENGTKVRVSYLIKGDDNRIVKLEIAP